MLDDPTRHKEWLTPHSLNWYKQLSAQQDTYTYSWNSTFSMPPGETVFETDVRNMIKDKVVLDIGCGDGAFAKECSHYACHVVGIDATDQFVQIGKSRNLPNVQFIAGNTHEVLPFQRNSFDCAYNRKGPTSAYPLLSAVMKNDGSILGIHPGDASGKELRKWFPNFFANESGTPILDKLNRQLSRSGFSCYQVEEIQSEEFLQSPMDIVKYRCFGQNKNLIEEMVKKNLADITKIFLSHRSENGLSITHSRYIVRAVI